MLAAILSPILTPIADNTGKKSFYANVLLSGKFGLCLSFLFHKDAGVLSQFTLTTSILAFIVAGLGYSGSIVFYNSFLPEIATEDQYDRLSARGFAMGYIGSVLLLIFNITMLTMPDLYFNVDGKVDELMGAGASNADAIEQAKSFYSGLAARISFLSVGIWWFLFAQYSFYYLPSNVYKKESRGNWLWSGFRELNKVLSEVRKENTLKFFCPDFSSTILAYRL